MKPKSRKKTVSVLYSPGTNCEEETMAAFRLAGANPSLLFLDDLIRGKRKITDCDLFCIPGGFSWGDNVKEGIITAVMIADYMGELLAAKIPSILICNGCQIGSRAKVFGPHMTLERNISGVFNSRPILHRVEKTNCIWTRDLQGQVLSFPAAHGGGRVIYSKYPNVVMHYEKESPNGGKIAGTCTSDGLHFGLMDHPERPYGNEDGLKIFRNGVKSV